MGKIMLNSRQYCGGGGNTAILHRYTATLTSSQYGWFTLVDENGNTFGEVDQKIPLLASSYDDVTGKYYTSQFVSYDNGTKYLFKAENINAQTTPQIEGASKTIEFDLTYIEFSANSLGDANYSMVEHTVGTWIDGSTLYEKTLLFNNKIASQDNTSELLHGVSNIGSVKFVDRVFIDFNGGQNWIPAENHIWVSTNKYYISWAVGSSAILLQSSDSQLSFDANPNRSYLFVIRYTKSST